MLIYLVKGTDRQIAEDAAHAAALEERGYTLSTELDHWQARQAEERAGYARLRAAVTPRPLVDVVGIVVWAGYRVYPLK